VPSFCRHNRFIQNCPICREPEPPRRPARSSSSGTRSGRGATTPSSASRSRPTASRGGGVRVRQLARATDDGYRSPLVPGLKASADAERLADEIAFAATRLGELATDPPGTYGEALLADREEGIWLALLTAALCPVEGEDPFAGVRQAHVAWDTGEVPSLDGVPRGLRSSGDERTLAAYRAWAGRAGSQEAALTGEAAWTPQRRFDRILERIPLPGMDRGVRFDFLVTLGRLGLADVQGAALHFGDDATTLAAKRVFGIGDPILLARRAGDLAEEAEVPLEALDLALFNWGQPAAGRVTMGSSVEPDEALRTSVSDALGL
jgi:hypothetical protein